MSKILEYSRMERKGVVQEEENSLPISSRAGDNHLVSRAVSFSSLRSLGEQTESEWRATVSTSRVRKPWSTVEDVAVRGNSDSSRQRRLGFAAIGASLE